MVRILKLRSPADGACSRIKRMKRVENKSRDRGHAGCQAICSAIPDADHVDPGNADARLSGGTRKSNGE
ncbi:hypothetical protein D4764_02G0008140 [Takifugu flavidus]|uniref:Uncharacterized protein n=1 Tax=Takifugu flavidus TaxID=433684 RepID=A0A5C6NKR3_9TELE|nr:hypothetical protein D4764_02G0008140 [Takifugu flavidus]